MGQGTARRKDLTSALCRQMKHSYPQAYPLASGYCVDVRLVVSHRYLLERAKEAFALNDRYGKDIMKIIIENH